ncbi:MAG: hypothetical protein V3W34_19915 [Phycisphaerae bacterium]
MFSVLRRLAPAVILPVMVASAGCNDQLWQKRESPLFQKPLGREALDRFYDPMIENAAAHNMSIGDGHFYPHSAQLNSLGAQQLDRIAAVLQRHGGTVRYETRNSNANFVDGRLQNIEEYLAGSGLEMADVEIKSMMSGGRGMSAKDAQTARIQAKKAAEASSKAGQRATATK